MSVVPLVRETPIGGAEGADGFWRKPAPANAGKSRHARIVPAVDTLLLHQLQQLALAKQRVGDVEPVEFNLLRRKDAELLDIPAVERLVVGELQRAHGVRDVLDRIRLAVRVVVHRIDAPLVAGAVVRRRAGCGTSPDRACSGWARPCRSWRAARGCRRGIRPASCAQTGRDFLRWSGCDKGCPCPAR